MGGFVLSALCDFVWVFSVWFCSVSALCGFVLCLHCVVLSGCSMGGFVLCVQCAADLLLCNFSFKPEVFRIFSLL